MTLAEFLEEFFSGLASKGIRFCVLRNHEQLPEKKVGNDIDLLVSPSELERATAVLAACPGISLLTVNGLPYVRNTFIRGVDAGCLQVDFVTSLSWRGMPYLETDGVLERSGCSPSRDWIPVPDRVDEAINSFFTSYLVGGFVKDRYAPTYVPVFRDQAHTVAERLEGRLPPLLVHTLISAAAQGNHSSALASLRKVRGTLLTTSLSEAPLATLVGLWKHFAAVMHIHSSSFTVVNIAVFGPDGAGKTAVIEQVVPCLKNCSKIIEVCHLRPRLPLIEPPSSHSDPVVDPHAGTNKSYVASLCQLGLWLASYWWDRWVRRKRNATLRIYDRYIHDVMVDPKRYRYGGPSSAARLASKMAPRLDLAIILDAPVEVVRSRKSEVTLAETARQRQAYLDLADSLHNVRIVDTSRPLAQVVAEVESLVLDCLAGKTARRLGLRSGE